MFALVGLTLALNNPRVTYSTRAARAEVVLPALGRAAGMELSASRETADEVLVIDVKRVPVSHLLDRIARVTSGVWVRKGSGFNLEPNIPERRHEALQSRQKRLAEAQAYLDTVSNTLASELISHREAQPGSVVSVTELELNALDELRDRLTQTVDPAILARLAPGERIVFASKPTAGQRGFNPSALQALTAYKQPEIDKAVLVVYRPDDRHSFNTFSKILGIYDRSGKLLKCTRDERSFPILDFFPRLHSESDKPVRFSSDSSKLLDVSWPIPLRPSNSVLGSSLTSKLDKPEAFDPLSYFQTDDVSDYAKAEGKPLVADLPDSWPCLPDTLQSLEVQSEVKEKVQSGFAVRRLEDTEFVTLKPADPTVARFTRMNRHACQELLQESVQKGVPSVDDVCRFVRSSAKPEFDDPIRTYLDLTAHAISDSCDGGDWETLGLYGSLSASERLQAASADGLKTGQLSRSQRDVLRHWLYSSIWTTCHRVGDGYHPFQTKPDPEYIAMYLPNSLSLEPSETFPRQIPDDAKLFLDSSQADCALATASRGYKIVGGRIWSGPDLLRLRNGETANFKRLSRTTITLRLRLNQDIEAQTRLFDYRREPNQ